MSDARIPLAVSARAPRGTRLARRAKALGWVALGVASLLVACGEQVAERRAARSAAPASVRGSASGVASADGEGQGDTIQVERPDSIRKLIQNAELHLEVDSCADARRAIEAGVSEVGGYVSSANVDHREGRVSRAVLVLRIPATALESSLSSYAELGTVVHETLTTQDITAEFFDLEARLENARKLEARLQELVATRAEVLTDLLEVERELARVRETIERFEGQRRLWEQQVAFSTLRIELATRAVFAAGEPRTLGEQIGHTISRSWRALVAAGEAVVLVVAAFLPWILPLLLLGWLLFRLLRWIDRKTKTGARRGASAARKEP